ncbi:patatin-like phospholipase family protein [Deinococcus cellulosilyticus]|uniref:Phospholipase n=1 Tax=Deinococcus cellulosilyticus (strain DSM 18568 / NBRC 106333 / KACC 11606 / 5516J-15) TaxID=1223518 RepID=A0A511MZF4_DEIC1|nr:patatin-like phospholipase family protein [Deinococcus cellulosilyticus]GEM45974.1 phospholipase [Deinococcus cellulosilyticus NBRC 106333 = KACC 11606]
MTTTHRPFGLALGGGGARGFAHIGVFNVLDRLGVRPSCIAGTSMGALLGAFYAAGYSASDIRKMAATAPVLRLLKLNIGSGLLNNIAFEAFLKQYLPERFEDLKMPFTITATDLISGNSVYFNHGSLAQALRCTVAYPGLIDPVWIGDQLLADGGILNEVPVDAVMFMGVRPIIAVDVTFVNGPEYEGETSPPKGQFQKDKRVGLLPTARRTIIVMQSQMTEMRLAMYKPDLLLRPSVLPRIDTENFWKLDEAVKLGEEAATLQEDRIRELLGL